MSSKKKRPTSKRVQPARAEAQEVARPKRLPKPETQLYVLLAATVLMILISRIIYLPIPFDRDEGAYGYLGWMALGGGRPYIDFYEMKPPLLFYAYALIVALFGKSTIGFHLCALIINLVSTWFTYRLGKALWKSEGAGLIAATIFYLLSMHQFVTGYAMQAEHIVVGFAIPGLFYTHQGASRRNERDLLIGGLLLSCAFLVKQTAVFYCVAGLLIVLLLAFRSGQWREKRTLRGILYFAAGGLLPISLSIAILAAVGSLEDFWYWIYQHSQEYLGRQSSESVGELFRWSIKRIFGRHESWFILAAIGLIFTPFCKSLTWRERIIVFSLVVFSIVTVVLGFRFYGHYWLCAIPGLAMAIPALFVGIPAYIQGERGKDIARLAVVLLLFFLMVLQFVRSWEFYYQPDFKVELNVAHPGNYFYEYKEVGDLLNAEMQPDDKLMVFGSEPEVYLYTKKKAPTRHFYISFTSKKSPRASEWQKEVMDDMNRENPEFLVLSIEPYTWGFSPGTSRKLYNWAYQFVRQKYSPFAYIELQSKGQSVIVKGKDAENYTPKTRYYTMLCRRNQ